MSCTTIFGFDKNGDSFEISDIKNAWRGAFAIWEYLGNKFIKNFKMFDTKSMKKVWKLKVEDGLSKDELIVLYSTFDNVLIKRENIKRLLKAMRNFDYETSLKEQADDIEHYINNNETLAIGFHQNSVSCEKWYGYNFLKTKEHWFLFEGINKNK